MTPRQRPTLLMLTSILAFLAVPLGAQTPLTGDVFGDLIHILRDDVTGQPILAERFVELPGPVTGYGWGYCPIAVDAAGIEIGFVPYTCDAINPAAVEEVDYFGRLNSARTVERNVRMHFDEVISIIKTADWVEKEGSARLRLGYGCTVAEGSATCADWSTIDSPMQNMGLYVRLMKYGHLQTDPEEVNEDASGDPEVGTVYHPALDAADWLKFAPSVRHLLPGDGLAICFVPAFFPDCAEAEVLANFDLIQGAGFLAGVGDKTGRMTVDLVQYFNRIAKICQATESTVSTLATLPALVRDCWDGADPVPPGEEDPAPIDPPYLPPAQCTILPAHEGLANYDLFYDVQEKFVDYQLIDYVRTEWRSELVEVILPVPNEADLWERTLDYSLLPWIAWRNGPDGAVDVDGFVLAASDALRWIEFIHNYEVPADLFTLEEPTDPNLIFQDGFESGDTSAWSAAS